MNDPRPELIFAGQVASPGLAAGHIRLHSRPKIAARHQGSPAEEESRLTEALETAAAQLARIAAGVEEAAQAILEFQIALLGDDELIGPVRQAIRQGISAPQAWRQALDTQVAE